MQLTALRSISHGSKKIGKICKISDEKFFFSPQILYIIFRRNSVKLGNFTSRVSGELPKIHHISPLTTNTPYADSNLSPRACQPLLPSLSHLPLNSSIFVLNSSHIHSTFCKTCALNFEIVRLVVKLQNFSGEVW